MFGLLPLQVPPTAATTAISDISDIPENHWIFNEMSILIHAGLLVDPSPMVLSRGISLPITGKFIAIILKNGARSAPFAAELARSRFAKWRAGGLSYEDQFSIEQVSRVDRLFEPGVVPNLFKMFRFFTKELSCIRQSADEGANQMSKAVCQMRQVYVGTYGEANSPFQDIPANQWAADAANHLKSVGVFVGSGGNVFRG